MAILDYIKYFKSIFFRENFGKNFFDILKSKGGYFSFPLELKPTIPDNDIFKKILEYDQAHHETIFPIKWFDNNVELNFIFRKSAFREFTQNIKASYDCRLNLDSLKQDPGFMLKIKDLESKDTGYAKYIIQTHNAINQIGLKVLEIFECRDKKVHVMLANKYSVKDRYESEELESYYEKFPAHMIKSTKWHQDLEFKHLSEDGTKQLLFSYALTGPGTIFGGDDENYFSPSPGEASIFLMGKDCPLHSTPFLPKDDSLIKDHPVRLLFAVTFAVKESVFHSPALVNWANSIEGNRAKTGLISFDSYSANQNKYLNNPFISSLLASVASQSLIPGIIYLKDKVNGENYENSFSSYYENIFEQFGKNALKFLSYNLAFKLFYSQGLNFFSSAGLSKVTNDLVVFAINGNYDNFDLKNYPSEISQHLIKTISVNAISLYFNLNLDDPATMVLLDLAPSLFDLGSSALYQTALLIDQIMNPTGQTIDLDHYL